MDDDAILYVLVDLFIAGVNTVAGIIIEGALHLTVDKPQEQSYARAD
jgi:hypothetical protein